MIRPMRRREFITLLGGAAAVPIVWPLAVRAQQPERVRRIGMLLPAPANDRPYLPRIAAFTRELQQLGWVVGRNINIDIRWTANNLDVMRKQAEELAALAPDIVVTVGAPSSAAIQRADRKIPIVFAVMVDPVGAGVVDSLARPGGNVTGFTVFGYGLSGKWLELLKQIAPRVTRAAVFRDASNPAGIGQFGAMQGVAP